MSSPVFFFVSFYSSFFFQPFWGFRNGKSVFLILKISQYVGTRRLSVFFYVSMLELIQELISPYPYDVCQGSTNSILACTDFRASKMVLGAHSCTQNYMYIKLTVGANLQRLIYNLLIAIVLSLLSFVTHIFCYQFST